MADYRRIAGVAIALLSFEFCSVHCFLAPTTSTRLRPVVTPSSYSTSNLHQQQVRPRTTFSLKSDSHEGDAVVEMERRGDGNLELDDCSNRRQALARAWKAALSLSTLALTGAGAASPAKAGVVEFLLPPQDDDATKIEVGEYDKEISFENFERALLKGEVKQCTFYGANFDKAIIQLKDESKALITEGYPEERAFSDDSPMKVVGLVRNAGVPFKTQYKMNKYSKPKSYKSVETLEAENRQRTEDQRLERLMSD